MKVTNADVWRATSALGDLCKEPWPVKTAYQLAKLTRKVAEAHRDVDKVRTDLVMRHGQAGEPGRYAVTPEMESFPAFAAAWNELMAEEVDIDWGPVALPVASDNRITPAVLMALEPFIEIVE